MNIHNIHFDLVERRVEFRGGYRQSAGPLPSLDYPLLGYWEFEGTLIKAVFAVDRLPTQGGDPILHRYEGPSVSQHGQACYRYFTQQGYGGMILSQAAYAKKGLPIVEAFHHLTTEANQSRLEAWKAERPPEVLDEFDIVKVPDRLKAYADTVLILAVPKVEEDLAS